MAKAPVRRMTNAERDEQIAKHPETDTRPRYADGTQAMPGDMVVHRGSIGKAQWFNRVQDVPTVAYTATVTDVGTVPLKECRPAPTEERP